MICLEQPHNRTCGAVYRQGLCYYHTNVDPPPPGAPQAELCDHCGSTSFTTPSWNRRVCTRCGKPKSQRSTTGNAR